MINMMNDIFQIDQVTRMIRYVETICGKGAPYPDLHCFIDLSCAGCREMRSVKRRASTASLEVVGGKVPDGLEAGERLKKVLKVMLLTHLSAQIKAEANQLLGALE